MSLVALSGFYFHKRKSKTMLKELDSVYVEQLEAIAQEIQAAEELAKYLEEEDEEDYKRLKELFEPKIASVHEEVAAKNPLQLTHLEKVLLHEAFEGLYLPKILGYSVLRGTINSNYKYLLPQEHFMDVLMAICDSPNFDILKQRIGQSIQVGFALSSDIWITNLINDIQNKRIRNYLKGQNLDRYRVLVERTILYNRYKRQFKTDNFHTTAFPETISELKVMFPSLRAFLVYRIKSKMDNASLVEPLMNFVKNEDFQGTDEHMEIMTLFASFFELEGDNFADVKRIFNKTREKKDSFEDKYLSLLLKLQNENDVELDGSAEFKISSILDKTVNDNLTDYYRLMDIVHGRGYVNDEVQEAVRVFDSQHQGRSKENEAVRRAIYNYFNRFISNLEEKDYPEFFEITKIFPVYMKIFANQQFNQDLKQLSMVYIKKLLRKFTDKRGKDYQDIKKFVSATFPEFGFLKEKEVVELFKTRRKRKPTTA